MFGKVVTASKQEQSFEIDESSNPLPEGSAPSNVEIAAHDPGRSYCPAEQDDDFFRRNGEHIYLSGCAQGMGTVEIRRASNSDLLQTYTFSIDPASASTSTPTPASMYTPFPTPTHTPPVN